MGHQAGKLDKPHPSRHSFLQTWRTQTIVELSFSSCTQCNTMLWNHQVPSSFLSMSHERGGCWCLGLSRITPPITTPITLPLQIYFFKSLPFRNKTDNKCPRIIHWRYTFMLCLKMSILPYLFRNNLLSKLLNISPRHHREHQHVDCILHHTAQCNTNMYKSMTLRPQYM